MPSPSGSSTATPIPCATATQWQRGLRMAAAGASVEEIAAYIQDWVDHVRVLFVAFDLKFAKKSGRVSAAAAFVGEALGLKPIMTFENGASKVVTKVRGRRT